MEALFLLGARPSASSGGFQEAVCAASSSVPRPRCAAPCCSVAVEPTRGGHVEGEDSTRHSAVLDAPRDRVPDQLHPP